MLDLDQFIADCRSALAADKSHKLVREVVARAVSDPAAVLKRLGEPARCALTALLSLGGSDHPEHRMGTPHDGGAAQSQHVGGDRDLHRTRGQHLLAPTAGPATADWRPPAQKPSAGATPSRWAATSSIR